VLGNEWDSIALATRVRGCLKKGINFNLGEMHAAETEEEGRENKSYFSGIFKEPCKFCIYSQEANCDYSL